MQERKSIRTVRWFNETTGLGFLTQENGGPDVFAHFSSIQCFKTLLEWKILYSFCDLEELLDVVSRTHRKCIVTAKVLLAGI